MHSPETRLDAAAVKSEDIAPLADAIYRDRVERARRQPSWEKFLDALQLHDEVIQRNKAGIRHQFPDADETRVHEILLERMEKLRRVQERDLYRPIEERDA